MYVNKNESKDIIINASLARGRDNLPYHELNKIEIKTCKECGYTKRLPYKIFICPECDMPEMMFFIGFEQLVGYIDMYGLKKIRIVDDELRREVLQAFQ